MQADVLDRRPDNGQTTGLGREGVDLICALSHVAEETFDGIGGLNVSMHPLRKRKKRERCEWQAFLLKPGKKVVDERSIAHSSACARCFPRARSQE